MRPLLIVLLCSVALAAQQTAAPQVTNQDLINGLKDPGRWLTYSGDYNGQPTVRSRRSRPRTSIN
jgi:hypothetical protein